MSRQAGPRPEPFNVKTLSSNRVIERLLIPNPQSITRLGKFCSKQSQNISVFVLEHMPSPDRFAPRGRLGGRQRRPAQLRSVLSVASAAAA